MKTGFDYFPLYVHKSNKLKFICAKFGLEGYGAIISLLELIFAQGYYCEWKQDDTEMFAVEYNIDLSKLNELVAFAIEKNFFNKHFFEEEGILTSFDIQQEYNNIIKILRRKATEWAIPDYHLLSSKDNNAKYNELQSNAEECTQPNLTKRTEPNQTLPNQTEPNQTEPNQTKPNLDKNNPPPLKKQKRIDYANVCAIPKVLKTTSFLNLLYQYFEHIEGNFDMSQSKMQSQLEQLAKAGLERATELILTSLKDNLDYFPDK